MAASPLNHTAFDFPNTFPPIMSMYSMVTSVGMPGGHAAHFHPDTIEICYVAKGRLDWWAGEDRYEIHPDDVVVLLPGIPHGSVDSTLQPCEYLSMHLNPALLSPAARRAVDEPHFGGQHAGQTETGDLIRRIFREHSEPGPYAEELCQSLINLIAVTLARHGAGTDSRPAESYLVRRATRIWNSEEGANHTVEEVAKALGVSTVWLTRVFRQQLGQAPGEWLRTVKVNEAKRLLTETDAPIIEIAVQLGYGSSQYFATAFRRDTGLSPSDYRQRRTLDPSIAVAPIA